MPHIFHLILGFTMLLTLAAQQAPPRAPVIQSVDLLVPVPPVTFNQAGSIHLVYELHITNFLSVDVTLNAVQVQVAEASSDRQLGDQAGVVATLPSNALHYD